MRWVKVNEEQAVEWLRMHQKELYFSPQYLMTGMNRMNISLLVNEKGEEIGFVDCRVIQKEDLNSHDDAEFLEEALDTGTYFYVETLNVRSSFQNAGYGKQFVERLKNATTERIMVYVTASSFEFWYNEGFRGINDDNYWLLYDNEKEIQAIA